MAIDLLELEEKVVLAHITDASIFFFFFFFYFRATSNIVRSSSGCFLFDITTVTYIQYNFRIVTYWNASHTIQRTMNLELEFSHLVTIYFMVSRKADQIQIYSS